MIIIIIIMIIMMIINNNITIYYFEICINLVLRECSKYDQAARMAARQQGTLRFEDRQASKRDPQASKPPSLCLHSHPLSSTLLRSLSPTHSPFRRENSASRSKPCRAAPGPTKRPCPRAPRESRWGVSRLIE